MSKWYSFEDLKRARTPMPLDSETGLPDNHVITVVERVISVDNSELIQNNVRTDTFTLNLDAEYDDLNVIVIFTKSNNINVQVAYSGQPVHIPASVMELTGSVAVSVVGLDDEGETRAVTKAAPDTFQVVASGAYTGKISQDDVDLLGQILKAVSDAETAITAAETATTAATNATSQAKSAATSANQAASSANSAASLANSAATKANSAAVDAQNAYDTLQPYMATIDSCANILHREVGPDSVVTADDSFHCKPVEMTVYGNTVQNLWVNPSGTANGVTFTPNADGSVTISGSAVEGNKRVNSEDIYVLRPNTQYTISIDRALGAGSYVMLVGHDVDGGQVPSNTAVVALTGGETFETFTVPSGVASCTCSMQVNSNGTASGTYRVMLNEGSEAEPWCPPGLNSVGQLREDEKNLWVNPGTETKGGVTLTANSDGTIALSGTNTADILIQTSVSGLKPNTTYYIDWDEDLPIGYFCVGINSGAAFRTSRGPFTTGSDTSNLVCAFVIPQKQGTATFSGTYRVMLSEGSTASPWVPPESESCVQVLTAGKNLLGSSTFTETVGQGGCLYFSLPAGTYTLSCYNAEDWWTGNVNGTSWFIHRATARGAIASTSMDRPSVGSRSHATFTLPYSGNFKLITYKHGIREMATDLQLELGSTATDYEPPNITTTSIDLQGHTLNALPDGTRDELHIDGGGNVVLEKRTQTIQLDGDRTWGKWDTTFVHYTSSWSQYGGSPTGYLSGGHFVDKLPASSALANGLYSANTNGNTAYLREPTFASDIAGVKEWMGANKPVVIAPLLEPQTIDLGTITPPTMAAPNVTAYVADDTPAEIELDYVRDINVVVDRLEKKVAGLAVMEATNV